MSQMFVHFSTNTHEKIWYSNDIILNYLINYIKYTNFYASQHSFENELRRG
jgi:hypothetical protein